ncbi:MAG: protein kinase [Deltaproteobacteria bacterium]|nr:protein kinase [Deltaproteobacteria bacterium]
MIGETIGNFRIVSRIGRGGMGDVYLAEQQSIGTRVAVKLLHEQVSADEEHVTRFFNEARAVQRIQHAGIAKIFDVGHHKSGHAYLVMEYLEGESLAQRLERVGKLHPAEVADLGRQIASVLDATHGAGITHRDLKPDNIFIVPDRELASKQRAKILDFGIAKLSGTLASVSPKTIGTMGTPAYMAPEQWGDTSKVDWRADLYSLGCVIYEMATARPPFTVTTIAEACGKHLSEVPARASSIVPGLPAELDALLAALLEKRPSDRPQSGEEVVKKLDALAERTGPAIAFGETMASAPPQKPLAGTEPTLFPPQKPMAETVATRKPNPVPAARTVAPAPERKRRWPFVIVGLVLAAGGGAFALKMLKGKRSVTAGTAPAADSCKVSAPPVLAGSSTEPVLLRYEFTAGESTEVTLVTEARLDTTERGIHKGDALTFTLEGAITWVASDRERFDGTLRFKTIGIDHATVLHENGQAQHGSGHWTTDDLDTPPEYATFRTLKDLPIHITVAPRGDILATNLQQIQDHLANEQVAPELRAAFTRDRLFRVMFLELPATAVKPGDRWRAGEMVHEAGTSAQLASKLELHVQAISADGTQVLIAAEPELRVDLSGKATVLSKQTTLRLWGQFDRNRHQLTASALRACAQLQLDTDGGLAELKSELEQSYDSVPVAAPTKPAGVPSDAAVVEIAAPSQPAPQDEGGGLGAAFRASSEQFDQCVGRAGGKGLARIILGSDGRIRTATVTGFSKRENACIASVVRTVRIDRKPGAPPFKVSVPIVIVPPKRN